MKTTDFFLILSAIYIAPHTDKKTGIFFAVVFLVAGMVAKFTET